MQLIARFAAQRRAEEIKLSKNERTMAGLNVAHLAGDFSNDFWAIYEEMCQALMGRFKLRQPAAKRYSWAALEHGDRHAPQPAR
jgi:hypothetical protein